MCIRDSKKKLTDNHALVTKADKGNTVAVSYTHLDVYKRQHLHSYVMLPRTLYKQSIT